jgi:hypothetical protein
MQPQNVHAGFAGGLGESEQSDFRPVPYLAPRIPEQGLRHILAIVLMVVGIRLISS